MGIIFKAPGYLIYFVSGIWGLVICFEIIEDLLGFALAIASLFVFPVALTLAPWYAALVSGDWFPLALVYGGGIAATILVYIGMLIDGD